MPIFGRQEQQYPLYVIKKSQNELIYIHTCFSSPILHFNIPSPPLSDKTSVTLAPEPCHFFCNPRVTGCKFVQVVVSYTGSRPVRTLVLGQCCIKHADILFLITPAINQVSLSVIFSACAAKHTCFVSSTSCAADNFLGQL